MPNTNAKAVSIFLFILCAAALGSAQLPAQTTRPTPAPAPAAPCPTLSVQAQPQQGVRDGQKVYFTANIIGGDPNVVPVIVWNVTAGSIVQGQNMRRIEVDSTGAGGTPDREIRAEPWISGYAPECTVQSFASVKVIPPAAKFGAFGEIGDEPFKQNIDALAAFLSQSTTDDVYVIAYAGRTSDRSFTNNWLRRIRTALVTAGVESRRISAMDGGFRETPLFDFWIVAPGAEPPSPSPTIKRSEIVYPKPLPKTTPPKKP